MILQNVKGTASGSPLGYVGKLDAALLFRTAEPRTDRKSEHFGRDGNLPQSDSLTEFRPLFHFRLNSRSKSTE